MQAKQDKNAILQELESGKKAYVSLSEQEKSNSDFLLASCKFSMLNFMLAPTSLQTDLSIIDKLFEISPKVLLFLPKSVYLNTEFIKEKIAKLSIYYKEKSQTASKSELISLWQEQRDILHHIYSYYD